MSVIFRWVNTTISHLSPQQTLGVMISATIVSAEFLANLIWYLLNPAAWNAFAIEISFVTLFTTAAISIPSITFSVWVIRSLNQSRDSLRESEARAEIANRSKSEFLANMSHELRTPLNAIIGFSEIMCEGIFGPVGNPKYIEYAKDINGSGQHLLDLINDILDLSKIEAGELDLYEQDVDVARAIRSCHTIVKERAEAAGVEVECDIASELPALCADERKLKQILINLLSNAIKFTPAGGKVTIRTWSDTDDGYVFQVADTGIGIALEDIPVALAPFRQIDSDLNRQYEGTGLGLPLTKALTELHGGCLDLQSEVGVGTTATVRLPAERIVSQAATGT